MLSASHQNQTRNKKNFPLYCACVFFSYFFSFCKKIHSPPDHQTNTPTHWKTDRNFFLVEITNQTDTVGSVCHSSQTIHPSNHSSGHVNRCESLCIQGWAAELYSSSFFTIILLLFCVCVVLLKKYKLDYIVVDNEKHTHQHTPLSNTIHVHFHFSPSLSSVWWKEQSPPDWHINSRNIFLC